MKTIKETTAAGRGWLVALVALGLLLRVAFLVKGATLYYGAGQEYINGDTLSYTRSFINLWETGHYTLEPLIPDASFGRLPGYPFFFGFHYVLFGPQLAYTAVAITQLLLDTAVIVLLHNLMYRWTSRRWPSLLVALLYATYPFAIIWVTIVGTEALNTFLTVLWLSLLTYPSNKSRYYFGLGALIALTMYVRVYMGILLPISVAFLLVWPANADVTRRRRLVLIMAGFGLLYIWWPVRNYLGHDKVILLKPVSAGYANQREDMQAYLDWLACWTNDNTTWLEQLIAGKPVRYPSQLFSGPAEERRAYELTSLAARCGSSFHLRRLNTHNYSLSQPPHFKPCNEEIAAGFDSLRLGFMRRSSLRYYTEVPLANLRKAFFKNATIHSIGDGFKRLVQQLLFSYRTLLLLLGLVGLLITRRQVAIWPLAAYFLSIYLYISCDFRSLEMRYLLQADVLMLLAAVFPFVRAQKIFAARKKLLVSNQSGSRDSVSV